MCLCKRTLLALVNVLPNPFGHSHVSPMCSQPFSSPKYYFYVPIDNPMICDSNGNLGYEDNILNVLGGNVANFLSLGYFSGYDASLDLYCIYLVDKPEKIMWSTFMNFSFDFSMTFTFLKRVLTFLATIISMLSYYHACTPYSVEFDKLLRAFTTSNSKSRVLK